MKTFYGGTFINKNKLMEVQIYTPIKLEYYKIRNEEEYIENYGIEILKTQYKGDEVIKEKATIEKITEDEKVVDNLLNILKRNEVTPVPAQEIIHDLFC